MKRLATLIALAALGIAGSVGISTTSAAYPAVGGAIQLTPDVTFAQVSTTTGYMVHLDDNHGHPFYNRWVTIEVTQDPGGEDGKVAVGSKVISKLTDFEGNVYGDLYVGDIAGTIILTATHEELSSQAIIEVVLPPEPVAPPVIQPRPNTGGIFYPIPSPTPNQQATAGAAGGSIQPPNTGDAGLVSETGSTWALVQIAAVVVLLTSVGVATTRLARVRSRRS